MKRMIIAFVATAALATAAFAAAPDSIVLKAKNGNVTFNHQAHAEKLNNCAACHVGQAEPGKLTLGKDAAHKLCIDCHKASAGPAKCNECHKK